MITVSVGDLQRNLNSTILPRIRAGESVEVIDKKSGEVKFHIVPPKGKIVSMDWPDYDAEAIECAGHSKDPVGDALDFIRADRDF